MRGSPKGMKKASRSDSLCSLTGSKPFLLGDGDVTLGNLDGDGGFAETVT
jgi:hypothetical protein